ncbi:MAG: hypothetical protein KY439_11450, partial [Actinobacteria bacterium]|nr:hypothetical protein [Actinomycetota bacterium]
DLPVVFSAAGTGGESPTGARVPTTSGASRFTFSTARPGATTVAATVGALRETTTVAWHGPDGLFEGYRLVATDGGIFSFGDAGFAGSGGGMNLGQSVIGMLAG